MKRWSPLVAGSVVVAAGALVAGSMVVAAGALVVGSVVVAAGALVAGRMVVAAGDLVVGSVVLAAGALVAENVGVAMVVVGSSLCRAGVLQTCVVGNFSICVVVDIFSNDHLALIVVRRHSAAIVGYPLFLKDLT